MVVLRLGNLSQFTHCSTPFHNNRHINSNYPGGHHSRRCIPSRDQDASMHGTRTGGRTICNVEELLENSLQDSFDGIEVLNASLLVESHNKNDGQQIFDVIVKVLRPRRARMYYLRYVHDRNNKPSLKLHQCTWLNCFPDSVPCHGIISCANGMAYGMFWISHRRSFWHWVAALQLRFFSSYCGHRP
jgi:hypothetical protein